MLWMIGVHSPRFTATRLMATDLKGTMTTMTQRLRIAGLC